MNTGNRSSLDEARPESAHGEEDHEVEPGQENILSHIVSQLRPGADLSRVVLPTFILEPQTMLERITNFMQHPETLLPMAKEDDPIQRFLSVVKFYLSGWHIKPPGVKKPLNPILGETYTCYWDYSDGTRGYYISEQTSHHPPKSSYFYMAPEHHIRIDGTLKPRSKFLGNSAASLMEGTATLRFMQRTTKSPGGERYTLTQPNMYARGILWGTMKYELGDHSFVKCPENDLVADIEFKTKGWVGGTYNAIGGFIKKESTQEHLYELSGKWNGEMFVKDLITGQRELLFDATHAQPSPPHVRPMDELGERESPKLWSKCVAALIDRNHDVATDEKTRIEDMQRAEAAKRAETGEEWHPKLFTQVNEVPEALKEGDEGLDWILKAKIDGETPVARTEQILAITPILPKNNRGPRPPPSKSVPQNPPTQTAPTPQTGDLLDFGPSGTSAVPREPTSVPQSDPHYEKFPQGLQQPLLPSATSTPLKASPPVAARQDTDTDDVDEFYDAKS
ncbi:MAG: hypothetical protein M1814_004151 [Vezdaea aestivalis]|nr:MAG: hypothetical protein M1814_004151 [Vezdaea aestivalis]